MCIRDSHTIGDVINEIGNLDRNLMESFLLPHPSGVRLLAAYTQPRIKDLVDASHIELILMAVSYTHLIVQYKYVGCFKGGEENASFIAAAFQR